MMRPLPLVTAALLAVALLLPAQAASASADAVPVPVPTPSAASVSTAEASSVRAQGPYEIYTTSFDGNIYELVDGSYPRPLSFADWRDVYGFESPRPADTNYVKYPWSPTVYAVTFWPGGESAWQWTRLSYDQFARAGFPGVRNAGYIVNSYVYKWGTSPEILVEGEDGVNHRLTGAEWRDMGYRPYVDRANEGFMKLSWTNDIVRMSDLGRGQGRAIGYGEWRDEAFPTPQVVQRITGDQFYRYSNSNQVWYAGPGMNRVVSFDEFRAAGSPAPRVIQVAGQPTPAPAPGPGRPPQPADVDCKDFRTQGEAQAFYNRYFPYYGDFADLDGAPEDGRVCESLPR
jgi:hypothetical protein